MDRKNRTGLANLRTSARHAHPRRRLIALELLFVGGGFRVNALDVLVILVIAVVVQFTEMVMHKTSPLLYQVLGIFLPLITTNCAVLGVALLNIQEQHSFVESALYGFGAAAGFSLRSRRVTPNAQSSI